jgi:hypothetical protein
MNNKTTLAGLLQFVVALVTVIFLFIYAVVTKTQLDATQFTIGISALVYAGLSFAKGALSADASNPILRVAARLFPTGEEKDIANAIAKATTAAAETAVQTMEKPKDEDPPAPRATLVTKINT